MRSCRKTIRRQPRGTSAFELLEAHLKTTDDDAAWYAERLELLGRALFGDLWRSDKAKGDNEAADDAGCEHLIRPSATFSPSDAEKERRGGEGVNR